MMHPFHIVLAAIFGIPLVTAFSVPRRAPDGLYMTYSDSNGINQVKSLSLHLNQSTSISQLPPPSALPQSGCNPIVMCLSDYTVASNQIRKFCSTNPKLDPGTHYFYSYQSAVFYICNFPKEGGRFGESDVVGAIAQIERRCGEGFAGWFTASSGLAFGFDNAGTPFCG
jgi:hypothetical protein